MKKCNRRKQIKIRFFYVVCVLVLGICAVVGMSYKKTDGLDIEIKDGHLINMNGISQKNIPTGCEAVSAVLLINYLGIEISPDEFINEYLPMGDFYQIDGLVYGPDPEEYFAGNPFNNSSLGCFPPVIVKAIEGMKDDGYSLIIEETEEKTLEELCERYIIKDIPVAVWVTMDMCEPEPGYEYFLEDGSKYTWTAGEHCMVLCGFDEDYYYLKDPLAGGRTVLYEKDLVEMRYEQMGCRGIVVRK